MAFAPATYPDDETRICSFVRACGDEAGPISLSVISLSAVLVGFVTVGGAAACRAVMNVDPMKLALQSECSRDDDLDPAPGVGELSACAPLACCALPPPFFCLFSSGVGQCMHVARE